MTGNFLTLSCDKLQLQAHCIQVDQKDRFFLPAGKTEEKVC